jgi:hypothetical protein
VQCFSRQQYRACGRFLVHVAGAKLAIHPAGGVQGGATAEGADHCLFLWPRSGTTRGTTHEPAGGASASPSSAASSRACRRAIACGHFRPARFHVPSERDRLARSASARTPGGRRGSFPSPIRPPPLPRRLNRPIADGGSQEVRWCTSLLKLPTM